MLDTVTGYLEKALRSKQTGSALSPLLWINGIVTVPCLLLAAFLHPPMSYAFFVLAVLIIAFSLWQYWSLVKIDPRLVQSEKLQFEMAKLDIVAQKGGSVIFDPVALEFSSEPPKLSKNETEEGGEQ